MSCSFKLDDKTSHGHSTVASERGSIVCPAVNQGQPRFQHKQPVELCGRSLTFVIHMAFSKMNNSFFFRVRETIVYEMDCTAAC